MAKKSIPPETEETVMTPLEWIARAMDCARKIDEENTMRERLHDEALAGLRHLHDIGEG